MKIGVTGRGQGIQERPVLEKDGRWCLWTALPFAAKRGLSACKSAASVMFDESTDFG
jgi:hypothetical protein